MLSGGSIYLRNLILSVLLAEEQTGYRHTIVGNGVSVRHVGLMLIMECYSVIVAILNTIPGWGYGKRIRLWTRNTNGRWKIMTKRQEYKKEMAKIKWMNKQKGDKWGKGEVRLAQRIYLALHKTPITPTKKASDCSGNIRRVGSQPTSISSLLPKSLGTQPE
jgi:hypothetical protein